MFDNDTIAGIYAILYNRPWHEGRGAHAKHLSELRKYDVMLIPRDTVFDVMLALDLPYKSYKQALNVVHRWLSLVTADHEQMKRTLKKHGKRVWTGRGAYFINQTAYFDLLNDLVFDFELQPTLSFDVLDTFDDAYLDMPVGITVILEVSNQEVTRHISAEQGITRRNLKKQLQEFINEHFPNFTLINHNIDEEAHVVNDYQYNKNTLAQDYLDELLHANIRGNCVTVFKNKYGLDEKYYDGMSMRDFIYACNVDNIRIKNNYLQNVNDVESPRFEVIAYNGHICALNPNEVKNICVRTNKYLDDEEFERLYIEVINNPDKYVITNIRVYNGVYGKVLKSFQIMNETVTYRRSGLRVGEYGNVCYTPTQVINELLRPYGCTFFNDYEKNHAIYSGYAPADSHAYDLNQAYINAFKNIRRVPLIANFPVTYKHAMLIDSNVDHWVCVVNPFKFNNIDFPHSLLFLTEALEYGATPIECFYIYAYKDMNGSVMYENIIKTIEGQFNDNTPFKQYVKLTKGEEVLDNVTINGRNKYVENCLRIALGNMERTCSERYEKNYISYLDELMNTTKTPYILNPINKLSVLKTFYVNVHLAMAREYRKMIMTVKNPLAVYCDCVYVNEKMDCGKLWKYCGTAIINRDCKKEYMKHTRFNVIVGLAGSGKTYKMKNTLDPDITLVIIPQYRLKTAWEGFECTSYQRITKNFKFTAKPVVCVDEAFQMDGSAIDHLIGMCYYYGRSLFLVGDPYQFEPVNKFNDPRDACFRHMIPTEKILGNYRNKLNYAEIFKNYYEARDKAAYLKKTFDRYLSKYLIDHDYENPVYCYSSGSTLKVKNEKITMYKHEQAYQRYVKENNISSYFVKCIKNCEYKGTQYYNGVIYRVNPAIKNSAHFIISNVYSIYTTQGQTMEKINLLKDDYHLYYSSLEMVYVLISRLKA